MSDANSLEDKLYRACIVWDVPTLRKSSREDAQAVISIMALHPWGPPDDELPKRPSPLWRAAFGLRAEFSGDAAEARRQYRIIGRSAGVKGLLGLCLLAWMSDATSRDFDRVVARAEALTGPGSRDLLARVHVKLASWASDHGWNERAQSHYDAALRLASGDLKWILEQVGHRFGRDQVIYFGGRPKRDTTSYRWISSRMNQAATKGSEDRLKASIRSPWSRTWTLGGSGSVEGIDIQSAELQASWAGTVWLMSEIQRVHAALILEKSFESHDVARAIGLWVQGGGTSPAQLVDAYEGYLSESAVADLTLKQLNSGRSVARRVAWIELCQSLWDQVPDSLVEELIGSYTPSVNAIEFHSDEAKDLELFALLLCRRGAVSPYIHGFSDIQVAELTRLLPHAIISILNAEECESLLSATLEATDLPASWHSAGWDAVCFLWSRLPAKRKRLWRPRLQAAIPDQAISAVAVAGFNIVPEDRVQSKLLRSEQGVRAEVANAARGMFTGWVTSPMTDLARLVLSLGEPTPGAVEALVSVTMSKHTSAHQRFSALSALIALAEADLLTVGEVAVTFKEVTVQEFMSDDRVGDQRLDDMARVALRTRLAFHARMDGALLAGARDSDARVRQVAVEAVAWLALNSTNTSAARDAVLLGALYDPDPRVQSASVRAIWEGHMADDDLRGVALSRLIEAWPQAHLRMRIAVAALIPGRRRHPSISEQLTLLASTDRSWQVRQRARHGST